MATQQGSSKSTLKTSLPSAYAAVQAEQPVDTSQHPSQEEQEKYLSGRPRATPQHLGVALQHAHQIQAQKDAENMILDRIIELLALPSSPSADPAAPSAADAQAFKSALLDFRPSDYDSYIMERNNEDLCGYGLCRREHGNARRGKDQIFQFKWGAKGSGPGGRGRSMDIVPHEKLEKWCSDECAERALFIRVQLTEQPVWERRGNASRGMNIELLEEARAKGPKRRTEGSTSAAAVTAEMKNLNLQDPGRSQELAMERGDSGRSPRGARVDVRIKEKDQSMAASAPEWRPEDATGGSIEGYVPQNRRDKDAMDLDSGDLLDQI
ncbi:uncharacterized protein N7482_001977 [Penicillium canariense]|uniref:RNA polymerase II subunit B1 CTD phosphatase RPAP2 homolog n=1 Tax=Penicillium canariense TaxID=189055 RepID=A0A9W9IF76_9EURO|nr:uncharacterized protein N7482_001977 [Penicillium canariense]KAJ5176100.1 hypothetical protein N7482_001977 [Penicillium canariense]